jgi:hypothetical protein
LQIPDNKPDASHKFPASTLQGRNSQIEPRPTDSQLECRRHRFSGLLEDIHKFELSIPKPKGLLEPDNTLLTSYMAHLVATGRPDAVAILITRAIPEFEPPSNHLAAEELLTRWQTSVDRGVTLGPHFFAVALNALRKAGFRRLAKRVWVLARAAEEKSLQSSLTAPWCLSVHAYTAMLQLYADETKGRHPDHTATSEKRPGHSPHPRNPRRATSGLREGMRVFHALPLAAIRVREAAVRARKEGREWKHPPVPPRADARFYNAALSLIHRRPGMRPCGSRKGSRLWWDHLLSEVRQRLLLTGQKPRPLIPELEEIAKSLRSSGYALPIEFGLRLVGRDEEVTSQDRTDFGARPYSFGKKVWARFVPHRLPTVKRKGLPVRGWWRRSGWSNTRFERHLYSRGTNSRVK